MSEETETVEDQSERKLSNPVSCKICFDSGKDEEPITPCLCKGSIGRVHLSCLEKWLGVTNAKTCELCGFRFDLTREPRFPVMYSVYYWLFKEKDETLRNRHALIDSILLIIIAPVFIFLMFLCVSFASNVNKDSHTTEFWPKLVLTVSTSIMGLALYLWTNLSLKLHIQIWHRWWKSTNVVRLLNAGAEHAPNTPTTIFMETSFA